MGRPGGPVRPVEAILQMIYKWWTHKNGSPTASVFVLLRQGRSVRNFWRRAKKHSIEPTFGERKEIDLEREGEERRGNKFYS